MKKSKLTTKQIVLTGMMTAVLAVLSIVTIPLPTGVPVTLQTFAMAFCGYVLGWKLGGASSALYLILGAFPTVFLRDFHDMSKFQMTDRILRFMKEIHADRIDGQIGRAMHAEEKDSLKA